MGRRQRVTLGHLANVVGLDPSTVSRALREDTARVSGATIARVKAAAEELGYRPDPVAASLRGGRSRTIGVLVPSIDDVAMAQLMKGIENQARELRLTPFLVTTASDPAIRNEAVRVLQQHRVDGLIFADTTTDDLEPSEEAVHVPHIYALRSASGLPSVVSDDRRGGELVAEHLLRQGHQAFLAIGRNPLISTARDRIDGFVEALSRSGVPRARIDAVGSGFQTEGGYQATAEALRRGSRPTAVFASNDLHAIGAIRALHEVGLMVGVEVAVVGYNDDQFSAYLPVPLTSVQNPLEEVGRRSVRALHQRIEHPTEAQSAPSPISPSLVVRESSSFVLPPQSR